jgi:hypothetical protein
MNRDRALFSNPLAAAELTAVPGRMAGRGPRQGWRTREPCRLALNVADRITVRDTENNYRLHNTTASDYHGSDLAVFNIITPCVLKYLSSQAFQNRCSISHIKTEIHRWSTCVYPYHVDHDSLGQGRATGPSPGSWWPLARNRAMVSLFLRDAMRCVMVLGAATLEFICLVLFHCIWVRWIVDLYQNLVQFSYPQPYI